MRMVVLGAGVVGIATAHALHEDGHDVTVLDREPEPARGASFANGGQVSPGNAFPWAAPDVPGKALRWLFRADAPFRLRLPPDPRLIGWGLSFLARCTATRAAATTRELLAFALHSNAVLADWRAGLGLDYDRSADGFLALYRSQQTLAHGAAVAALWREAGLAAEVVDRARVAAIEPALAAAGDTYAGGVFLPGEGGGDARRFTLALAERAAAGGVAIRCGVEVAGIEAEGGAVRGVRLAGGEKVAADAVVVCLGAWSPRLLGPLGVRVPVYPGKGYSVTVPVAGSNAAPRVAIADEDARLVVTRMGERLRVAGILELAGFDTTLPERRIAGILGQLRAVLPEAADYNRAEGWTGLRPMTPDGKPLIGATGPRGLWLNTGHGPLGWTLAPASARLLADLIAGRRPDTDPAPFTPGRR